MGNSLWIIQKIYLSTDLPVSKSDTPQKHKSLIRENKSLIRKEISYHQNYEVIFPIINEKFEYKVKASHEGKVGNSNCVNSLLYLLHLFVDLIIKEAAPPFFYKLSSRC